MMRLLLKAKQNSRFGLHILKTNSLLLHKVFSYGKVVSLSVKEFEILTILAQSPHRVFTHDQIMRLAWKEEPLECDNRTVMVHISNLRKKIENNPQNPRYILTVRGVGYKFGRSDSQ